MTIVEIVVLVLPMARAKREVDPRLPDRPGIPSGCNRDPALPSAVGLPLDGTTNRRSATDEAVTKDSNHLDIHDSRDLSYAMLVDKAECADPQEQGSASTSMLASPDTNSTGVLDLIEVVGVNLDKGKGVDPRERGYEVAKYEPGPVRIDFDYKPQCDSESTAVQSLQMQPLQLLEPHLVSHESPIAPPLPQIRWHPKISLYRLVMLLTPMVIGTVKAIISAKGGVTAPITIEWVSGVVVFLVCVNLHQLLHRKKLTFSFL